MNLLRLGQVKQQWAKDMTTGVRGHPRWSSWRKKNEWSLEVLREPKSSLKPGESTGVGEGRGGDQRIET